MNTLALLGARAPARAGLLRAVGASRRGAADGALQSILTAWIGATLGLVLGVFLAWMVVQAVGQGLEFSPPLGSLAVHAAFATVVGVLAAVRARPRAAKTDALVALGVRVVRTPGARARWGAAAGAATPRVRARARMASRRLAASGSSSPAVRVS